MENKLTNLQQLRSSALEAKGLIADVAESAASAVAALEEAIAAGGAAGKSAYQYAVGGGYAGTEAEFQALMGSGPWLPVDGSRSMEGILDLSGYPISFGRGQIYLGSYNFRSDTSGGEEFPEETPGEQADEEDNSWGEAMEDADPEDAESGAEEAEIPEGQVDAEEEEAPGYSEASAEECEEDAEEEAISNLLLFRSDGSLACLSVGTPEETAHAATKGYVDGLLGDIAAILDNINGEVA